MLNPNGILFIGTALLASLSLLSCSPRPDEIVGILKSTPSYDSSVPHGNKFGKLLLEDTNGHIYALKESKGFQVFDAAGNPLSEKDGQYPIYFNTEHRLIGRIIEISEAKRRLSHLWYPPEATILFEVETMIASKVPTETTASRP
jgi:hypothetical protein